MGKNNDRDVFDYVREAIDLVENNQDTIKKFMGSKGEISGQEEPLADVHNKEDEIEVIVEDNQSDGEIDIEEWESGIKINTGTSTVKVMVEDELDFSGIKAKANNGVFRVIIPKEK